MTTADVAFGMRLKDLAGWNQTSEDWSNLLDLGGDGCCVAEWERVPVGTFTTVNYEGLVGWIGMVLVDPNYRRRGIGTFLIKSAVDSLDGRCRTVMLDATPAGREVYLPLGFRDRLELQRRVRAAGASSVPETDRTAEVRPCREEHLAALRALDRECFGVDRSEILMRWFRRAPDYAFVARDSEGLCGFCLGRRGTRYEQVGPLVAKTAESAEALLARGIRACGQKSVVIDALIADARWIETLERLEFRLERPFIRMSRGPEPPPARIEWQWAAAGPEVG